MPVTLMTRKVDHGTSGLPLDLLRHSTSCSGAGAEGVESCMRACPSGPPLMKHCTNALLACPSLAL